MTDQHISTNSAIPEDKLQEILRLKRIESLTAEEAKNPFESFSHIRFHCSVWFDPKELELEIKVYSREARDVVQILTDSAHDHLHMARLYRPEGEGFGQEDISIDLSEYGQEHAREIADKALKFLKHYDLKVLVHPA